MSPKRVDQRSRLLREVRSLPTRPGVYLFRDSAGQVLYVGKARSLRSRVRSYFGAEAAHSARLVPLVRRIHRVETIVVESDAEALLLEWNLIKEHGPRFNIQLRDDKSYPYIRVTVAEPFPRVLVTRRLKEDGSRYFGPFTDVGAMRRALRTLKRMYSVRSCHYDMPREVPARPCLDYHIGRCKAPCAGRQSEAEYRAMIDEIVQILSGNTRAVRRQVRQRMEEAAARLEFELASELRDVLKGLDAIERRQTAIDFRGGDRDVLGVAVEGRWACGVVLKVRYGRLLGRSLHHVINAEGAAQPEILSTLVKAFYLHAGDLPPELLVPGDFPDRELIRSYLSALRDGPFRIHAPQRGHKRRLVDLARRNAAHELRQRHSEGAAAAISGSEGRESPGAAPSAAGRLADVLGLARPPRTLVCFDISTLGGSESVGSAVWLREGSTEKQEYRRFKVRAANDGQPNDYAMMQEVVGRYFDRRVREGRELPDLVVVDGGRGQLSAAGHAMESAGVSDLPLVALAKREEEMFVPGRGAPLRLKRADPALRWLQRARDEAHRFALQYNRSLRRHRTLRSGLSDIPGVGPARERQLLRRFGSLDAVRRASAEELEQIPGIGRALAVRVQAALAATAPEGREMRSSGTVSAGAGP
ncbi:MAG: excinuclease ABC subunit UvrC [Gemmatimonadota bacterium]